METNYAAIKNQTQETPATANAMLTELKNIRARHQWIIKRSAEISAQIEIFERRKEYVRAALEESQKIAEEIGHNAERRVYAIMTNAHRVIEPQQAQINELENQIAELKEELKARPTDNSDRLDLYTLSPELDYSGIELPYPEYSYESESYDSLTPAASPVGQICALELNGNYQPDNLAMQHEKIYEPPVIKDDYIDLIQSGRVSETGLNSSSVEGSDGNKTFPTPMIDPDNLSAEQIEFYINQAAGLELTANEPIAPPPDSTEFFIGQPCGMHEAADIGEYEREDTLPQSDPPKRQFSLREPEDEEAVTYQPKARELNEPVETYLQTALKKEFSVREAQPDQGDEYGEIGNTPPMSVIAREDSYNRPCGQPNHPVEQVVAERKGSSIMHLDVFVDTRHHHNNGGGNNDVHNHRWQIKVQVEVPEGESQEVGYSQLLAAVTATLLRFDDVLLNDIFPFDRIEPSHDNIAAYFFNCLEDTVIMKELRLIEVGLWEKQNLVMQVHARNKEFDELLKGEDVLQRMRGSLFHEGAGGTDTTFKKMLGAMFKGKN